jgi:hypothetical protein
LQEPIWKKKKGENMKEVEKEKKERKKRTGTMIENENEVNNRK